MKPNLTSPSLFKNTEIPKGFKRKAFAKHRKLLAAGASLTANDNRCDPIRSASLSDLEVGVSEKSQGL